MLVPADELQDGFASGLRLELLGEVWEDAVSSVLVEAGPCDLDLLDPTFFANRNASRLDVVADVGDALDAEIASSGRVTVDVPFLFPVEVRAGRGMLLDVQIRLAPGVSLAAYADEDERALLEDIDSAAGPPVRVTPAALLLVTAGVSQARSRWYDSGALHPRWQTALVDALEQGAEPLVVVEFQSAPAGAEGSPDEELAGAWRRDLAQLEEFRFVRFRVRFLGMLGDGRAPRVDRVVLPYLHVERAAEDDDGTGVPSRAR
jgi:hypothetical protein